jgi:16S rRNA (cytosine967-C5)-methyltransferase
MPVSPARAAAFDILLRVARESSYASELLHSPTYQRLSTPDHALAMELVMGVLRWQLALDDEIVRASSQPLAKLDLEILIALRLALYQLRWLDRIPHRAAIHESVDLVKRARKSSAAAFVNAVLRKLSISTAPPERSPHDSAVSAEFLARAFAHPLWLVERWVREYGLDAARRICQYDQSVPTTAIRLRSSAAEASLRSEGIELAPGALLTSARRVQAGDITRTKAIRSGQAVIQDEASQLIAALVGSGSRMLDCCAAPGGKTLALADLNPNATITAIELHPHRARLLQRLLASKTEPAGSKSASPTPADNLRVLIADASSLPPSPDYDRILADVPCSGTGTLARNPEIKLRLVPGDLAELAARQRAILRSAMAQLAPRGCAIYSTCALEREENEDVIEQFLAETSSYRLLDCRGELDRLKSQGILTWPDVASLTRGPYLRTLPGIHPSDGFFAAVLERSQPSND